MSHTPCSSYLHMLLRYGCGFFGPWLCVVPEHPNSTSQKWLMSSAGSHTQLH